MKARIDFELRGEPVWLHVHTFAIVPPDINADNPYDYHGYTDVEYDAIDMAGNDITSTLSVLEDESAVERITGVLQ